MKSAGSTITKRKPLGEILVDMGHLTRAELDAALAFKQENGLKLGQALVALHLVNQSDLAQALRAQGTVHCIYLTPELVDPQVARELGEERSRQLEAVAINKIAGIVTVAVEDPTDSYGIEVLSLALNAPVLAVHAEPDRIAQCLDHVFGAPSLSAPLESRAAIGPLEARVELELASELETEREPERGDRLEAATAQLVTSLLEEAEAAGASDVHFESRREELAVRYRVEGELHGTTALARTWVQPVLARLKQLANLDVGERRLPQEGKFKAELRGQTVDLRVATAPTLHGESAVVRILDCGRRLQELGQLPFDERQRADLERLIAGGGLVLAAGPSRHGRTSTLYALLQRIDACRRKIVTVEDPVEDQLTGTVQLHVNGRAGFTYARAVRAALAQDPDVLLVGDLRDLETAEVVLQAALAGKLVFSTLHAPGAAEAITRLADMGLEPYLIADALRGVVAQRLVRRLCAHCRRMEPPSREIAARLAPVALPDRVPAAVGCEGCGWSGFRGRIALYEVLAADARLWDAIRLSGPAQRLRELARGEGFTTLREDGIAKALAGETTLDEVYAATARG
ncbi:MAG: Flp pilus assembly complex ATPase component TadA [Planctomycetes bacterium]|nr:Flp pilus assembly complex ATPase component TadA [Planctomycetota bacterium]